MRIVYMGTPEIAVPSLRFLAESKHEVLSVFTQPDRPKGRGHHTIPTAVKAAALEYDIPVYQPLSFRKGEDAEAAMETLRQLAPDLIVVLAYGQILPKAVLELPKRQNMNICCRCWQLMMKIVKFKGYYLFLIRWTVRPRPA